MSNATRFGFLVALLFFGALFWAQSRDPFTRLWFKIRPPNFKQTQCIAVLPKMASRPLPTVIYLHGSGGSPLASGNELRQIAEMGLAAVGLEYDQSNTTAFQEQFVALNNYLRAQKWADMNRVAWVGFSFGAQRLLAFALKNPLKPNLLVRVSGGWVAETEASVQNLKSGIEGSPPISFLEVHGGQDQIFPIVDAEKVVACLRSSGLSAHIEVFPEQQHDLDPNRLIVFRAVAEYCLAHLKGRNALTQYQSVFSWQAQAKPLWLFWIPAGIWALVWGVARGLEGRARDVEGAGLMPWEIGLRWVAAVLSILAVGQTALHVIPPRLPVSERTLAFARKHLLQKKELDDFNSLSKRGFWSGNRLGNLLTHVQLTRYNRELINWKLDEEVYRDFVLPPQIDPRFDGKLDWRRELWENFYPRIRKETTSEAAALIVVRFLRERVTISQGEEFLGTISEMWLKQIANERGFEALFVAALRSVGVPARLISDGSVEFWTGNEWKPAPRPLVRTWTS